jgi:hypothetical protein
VVVTSLIVYRHHQRGMSLYWTEPTTKHAFQLSLVSLVMTILAIIAGVALFLVCSIACVGLRRSSSLAR